MEKAETTDISAIPAFDRVVPRVPNFPGLDFSMFISNMLFINKLSILRQGKYK